MPRTYVHSNSSHVNTLFGITNKSQHLTQLVDLWYDNVSKLQSLNNLLQPNDWTINRKEFIVDAIDDFFQPLRRYGYTLSFGVPMVDEKTQYLYQIVTVTRENAPSDNAKEVKAWTPDDVGNEKFLKDFYELTGLTGIPTPKIWQIWEKFNAMQSTIESMSKRKSTDTVTTVLVFSTGAKVDNWMLKITNDNVASICADFKNYMTGKDNNATKAK